MLVWLISLINPVVYWLVCLHPDKPNCVGLDDFVVSLAMCEPSSVPYSLEKSCPAQGWQCCLEIDEHIGLWLGETLQQHSWLQDKLLIKISISCVSIPATVLFYK